MIRVCMTKRDVLDARDRRARNRRKDGRGQDSEEVVIRLTCKVDGGHRPETELLPNGDVVEAVVVDELNDLLCPRDALKFKRRESDMLMADLLQHLKPCTWNLEPWDPSQPQEDKVPHLYIYVCTVAAPVAALTSA